MRQVEDPRSVGDAVFQLPDPENVLLVIRAGRTDRFRRPAELTLDLFGDGAHDSTAFGAEFGDFVTLGGYFANGEVGPLGAITGGASRVDKRRRETHQHEYTTVVAMIASLDDTDDTGD